MSPGPICRFTSMCMWGARLPGCLFLRGASSLRGMARPRTPAGRARETAARLAQEYPDSVCALHHDGPFQLLVATILSAQNTDERVNLVTPALFARYPTPTDLASADPLELQELIKSSGF